MTTNEVKLEVVESVDKEYCNSKLDEVPLYCHCFAPWIHGTTAVAIYGDKRKEYDAHDCCKCDNWFHGCCLSYCNIKVPKRNDVNICPDCEVPDTITWQHHQFINTCTSDNFLTITLLHCQQNHQFLRKHFGSSNAEDTLKAGLKLMLNGKIRKGKGTILLFVGSKIELSHIENKRNCYGTEYNMFLCLQSHVWKISAVHLLIVLMEMRK